jgi:hypothetical protein
LRSAVITGLVVDAATGRPLEPEELKLFWISPWKQRQGQEEYEPMWGSIDADIQPDGSFSIGMTQAGTFRVQARAPGFAPSLSDPFELKQNGAVSGILVRLEPGIRLDVIVLDGETREPVAGAVVSVHEAAEDSNGQRFQVLRGLGYVSGSAGNSGGSFEVELGQRLARVATGLDGRAEILSLIPGSFVLEATRRGYASTRKAGVTILPAVAPEPIELLMGAGGAVIGTVTNNRGEPEPALKVMASGPKGARGEAISLSSGEYRIENLTPGRYRVMALLQDGKPGNSPARGGTKRDKRELTEAEQYPVVVTEGQDSRFDVSVTRVDPGSLKGTVMMNGATAAGIQLIASPIDPANPSQFSFNFNLRAKSDAFGKFEFRRLDPGRYSLLVFKTWSANFRGGEAQVNANQETLMTIDVGLGSVGGVVLDAESRRLSGARVQLAPDRSSGSFNPFGGHRSVETGSDGSFLIDELEAGPYDLTVNLKGHATQTLKRIEVASRRYTGPLQIRLAPGGWIKLRVAGAAAFRPDRLQLDFQDADQARNTSRWVRPDDDGLYWFELGGAAKGTLTVRTRGQGGQPERTGQVPVELQEGQNAEISVELR